MRQLPAFTNRLKVIVFILTLTTSCGGGDNPAEPEPLPHELVGTWSSIAFSIFNPNDPGPTGSVAGNITLVIRSDGSLIFTSSISGNVISRNGSADAHAHVISVPGFNSDGTTIHFAYTRPSSTTVSLSSSDAVWDFGAGDVPAQALADILLSP